MGGFILLSNVCELKEVLFVGSVGKFFLGELILCCCDFVCDLFRSDDWWVWFCELLVEWVVVRFWRKD